MTDKEVILPLEFVRISVLNAGSNIPEAEEVSDFFFAGVVGDVLNLGNVSLFHWKVDCGQY